MNIYLMRHGETAWNVLHLMQGRSDIPLNENGLEQARKTAEAMKEIPFDCILSSPLQRAQQTAQIVAEGRDVPVLVDKRLVEMGFGAMEGLSLTEHPDLRDVFFNDPEHYVPSKEGETFAQLSQRCGEVLDELLPYLAQQNHQNVLLVSHGAFIRGVVQRVMNRPLSQFWNNGPMKNCSCTVLKLENGAYELVKEGRIFA